MLVLRGRRPLHLGCRRLARCEEGRSLGGAGADPPGGAGPHGRLRQGHRAGLGLRHDWGSQYRARQFQAETKWLGIRSTPAYVGEPECNGVAERFIRTLKEECIYVLHNFETLEEAREVIGAFIERYNDGWLLQRHGYMTRPVPARSSAGGRPDCLGRPLVEETGTGTPWPARCGFGKSTTQEEARLARSRREPARQSRDQEVSTSPGPQSIAVLLVFTSAASGTGRVEACREQQEEKPELTLPADPDFTPSLLPESTSLRGYRSGDGTPIWKTKSCFPRWGLKTWWALPLVP